MNNHTTARGCAVLAMLLAGIVLVPPRPAQAAPQRPSPEQLQELMARAMAAAQPGPEHQRLARMQGNWDVEIKMWPAPGAAPVTMTGSSESQMILGDRFLMQTLDIADTDPTGEQVSIIGFDRRSDDYIIMGMDTVGTYWVTARGPADESGDRAVLSGEDYDAIFEGTQIYDFVLSWPDEDTFVVEIIFKDDFHTEGGPPFKMVEVTSRRRQ